MFGWGNYASPLILRWEFILNMGRGWKASIKRALTASYGDKSECKQGAAVINDDKEKKHTCLHETSFIDWFHLITAGCGWLWYISSVSCNLLTSVNRETCRMHHQLILSHIAIVSYMTSFTLSGCRKNGLFAFFVHTVFSAVAQVHHAASALHVQSHKTVIFSPHM